MSSTEPTPDCFHNCLDGERVLIAVFVGRDGQFKGPGRVAGAQCKVQRPLDVRPDVVALIELTFQIVDDVGCYPRSPLQLADQARQRCWWPQLTQGDAGDAGNAGVRLVSHP